MKITYTYTCCGCSAEKNITTDAVIGTRPPMATIPIDWSYVPDLGFFCERHTILVQLVKGKATVINIKP
jgi:hypothetical protein